MNKEKFKRIEQILLAVALFIILVVGASVIYSLGFLSSNLIQALAPGGLQGESVNFDLKGFNDLGIQIPK